MVESSIPTFEAFCTYHEPTSLVGDQACQNQYLSVVRQYASLASTRAFPGKDEPSKPIALRWRNAGLKAIKSIASSEALAAAMSEQYDITVPMILENLWTDNEDFLDVLCQRAEIEDKMGGALLRRRTSITTVQTTETEAHPNPSALADSAADMDKLAEEDTGVLAMECLHRIFIAPNRSQVHAATLALVKFIQERVSQQEEVVKTDSNGLDSGWAIKMFLLAARWAPVADRFTILVTAMDTLSQYPLNDDTLRQHIVLAAMIGALLRSDINLIGLSVMDVLLQLLSHIRRLVQLPGDPNNMRTEIHIPGKPDPRTSSSQQFESKEERIIAERKDLLFRLQECIGDLATHVYYAEQISDMISTILLKLKPSRLSNSNTPSPQGEKSDGTPKSSAHQLPDDQQQQHADSLFSLTVAKIAALRAIKSVLLVANPRHAHQRMLSTASAAASAGASSRGLSRSRVPVQVWDGTQWLLHDSDGLVRQAYADAVVTWLDRETTAADSRARDDSARSPLKSPTAMAKRTVLSPSPREKPPVKIPRSHFLQLLHVAIYDNALDYIEYEADIVLLHILLAKLVEKLGINAVRYGLPMIFRLQEDIQDAETPVHKVRLGSLVHGYFWALTEKFDFEGTVIGRAIHNEIVRRRSKNFWVDGVNIPTPLIEIAGIPGVPGPQPRLPLEQVESEALLPFDEREALIECVCEAYQVQAASPLSSPAASPGRSFAHPVGAVIPAIETEHEVPPHFREQMLTEWSREAALAAVQTTSKSASLNGSRAGTTATRLTSPNNGGGNGNGLAVQGNGRLGDKASPAASRTNLRPSSSPSGAIKARKSSFRSGHSPSPSPPSHRGDLGKDSPEQVRGDHPPVASVEQLKLVLSGQLVPPPSAHGHHCVLEAFPPHQQHYVQRDGTESESSDSLISYDMAPSELSFNPTTMPAPPPGVTYTDPTSAATTSAGPDSSPPLPPLQMTRTISRERKAVVTGIGGSPLNSHPLGMPGSSSPTSPTAAAAAAAAAAADGVVSGSSASRRPSLSKRSVRSAKLASATVEKSRERDRGLSTSSWRTPSVTDGEYAGEPIPPPPALDLQALLRGIDSISGGEGMKASGSGAAGMAKPPY